MKKTAIAAVLAVTALMTLPAMADTVQGFDVDALEATLNDSGLPVDDLEEWGSYIRGWGTDANGNNAMVLIDADTFQPVR